MYLYDRTELGDLPPSEAALRGGKKAQGLLATPSQWCPDFLVISTCLYRYWLANGFDNVDLDAVAGILISIRSRCGPEVMLRSSASDEGVRERGKYESVPFDVHSGPTKFLKAVREVFDSYHRGSGSGEMAVIAQRRIASTRDGFLSNQLRVAAKPYQWVIQEDIRTGSGETPQPISTSAKQAHDYSPDAPLMCTTADELNRRLKSVARYFWQTHTGPRQLLEWVWDGSRLWVVQHDLIVEQAVGVDPTQLVGRELHIPLSEEGETFRRYWPGTATGWNKLRKLARFSTGGKPAPHRLFFASGQDLIALDTVQGRRDLAAEIDELTAGRAVLRTDVQGRTAFSLPRTDTVSGKDAVAFIFHEIAAAKKGGIQPDQLVFILHAFIHAQSAAWTYFQRGSNQVRVDGLWGLADGIQFYPHDTYVYDPFAKAELSAQPRFKSHVLCEQDDGEWTTEPVREALARRRSLSRAEVADMASRTVEIANNSESDVQIMWFVGIPTAYGLGANLPWYMVVPDQPPAERRSHLIRSHTIRSQADLAGLADVEPASTKIIFEPAGEDIRNTEFIKRVGEICAERHLPIELRGSILAHGFHLLSDAGADVYSAEPGKKPQELRQRKAYDKLVRDEIPRVISEGGEFVEADKIARSELLPALAGKMVEEVEELVRAPDDVARLDELADVFEVLRAMIVTAGSTSDLVAQRATLKRSKRGGFDQGIILRATQASKDQEKLLFLEASDGSPRTMRLSELATKSEKGNTASIPITELFSEIGHRRFLLKLHNAEVELSIELSGGRLGLRLHAVRLDDDPSQGDLFRPPLN